MEKRRKSYDRQYKIDAVSLVVNRGRTVMDVARELGMDANTLYRWKREFTKGDHDAFPGKGSFESAGGGTSSVTSGAGACEGGPRDF